jgi:hypothetical protein
LILSLLLSSEFCVHPSKSKFDSIIENSIPINQFPERPTADMDDHQKISSKIILVLILIPLPWPILPNRDLDALRRETLTQIRALDHAREAFRRVDGEDLGEAGGEDGGFARVDAGHGDGARGAVGAGGGGGYADVDEGEAESGVVRWGQGKEEREGNVAYRKVPSVRTERS